MEPEMPYTETDPKIAREIAEAAFRSDGSGDRAERVEAALIASGVAGPVLGEKFDAWSTAVGTEYDRLATVRSRPDGQQDGAAGRVEAWLDNRIHSTFYGPVAPETICSYPIDGDDCSIVYVLTESDLRAVLAENKRLRLQNDELFTENHEMQHGPTMSAEEWEADGSV